MSLVHRLLVVLAAVHAAFSAALPHAESELVEPDVYGGSFSKPGAFPFIAALSLNGTVYCDGVLLNAHTLLTAAHCTPDADDDADPSWFRVHVGSLNLNSGGVWAGVSNFLVHPEWDSKILSNDLALWRLSGPVYQSSTISYAVLPQQGSDPPAGAALTVAGWGGTNESPVSTYLREVTMPVGSHAACMARFNDTTYIPETMFCAGERKAGKDACQGDSGGPGVDAKSRVLWGLVSWGPRECGEANHYDVYVRVGNFVDWIKQHMFSK